MNFKEVMDKLDSIWDWNNKQRLLHPNYSHQYLPENWRVKICTSDNGWGAVSGVFIKGIYTGIDWDDGNILIYTDEPIYKEPKSIPIHKQEFTSGSQTYLICSRCDKRIGKTDKFCKHCGKMFSGEIKKEGEL